jgi:hypothetical protein
VGLRQISIADTSGGSYRLRLGKHSTLNQNKTTSSLLAFPIGNSVMDVGAEQSAEKRPISEGYGLARRSER